MLERTAETPRIEPWREFELGLPEASLQARRQSNTELEIRTISGKRNIISLSKPELFNLATLCGKSGKDLPEKIKVMLANYLFYEFRFVCTFKPDKGCKFVWARVGITFSEKGSKGGGRSESPIAYDMYPTEVSTEIKIRRTYTIGPNFKFKDFIQANAAATREKELIRYEPEIISFGLLQSDPCWDFSKSNAKDYIIGDKELFIILKVPKGMGVKFTPTIIAEVQSFSGLFSMIPIKIYKMSKNQP